VKRVYVPTTLAMWQRLVADGSMFPVTGTRRPDTPDPALGRSLPAPAPGPSTTNIATPEISITKHYAPSPTVSSASSTAAYTTTRSTTNTKPGHTAHQQPLDAMKGRGLRSSSVPGGCWGCHVYYDKGGPL
jgi:hypothetical protein